MNWKRSHIRDGLLTICSVICVAAAAEIPVTRSEYESVTAFEILRDRASCLHQKVKFRAAIVCNGPLRPNMCTPFGFEKSAGMRNVLMFFNECPPEIKEHFRDATLLQIHDDPRLKPYEFAFAFLPWSSCPVELRGKLSSRELECGDEVVLSGVVGDYIEGGTGYKLFQPITLLSVQEWEAGAVQPRPKLPDANSLEALAVVRGSTVQITHEGRHSRVVSGAPPKKPIEPMVIPGTSVFFRSEGGLFETTSDQFGEFAIALPEGTYNVGWRLPWEQGLEKEPDPFRNTGQKSPLHVGKGEVRKVLLPVVETFLY